MLALPLVGLALLLARPELDIRWEHHPSHFWLVLVTAAVSVALAFLTNEAANRRADARILLVSLAFLVSAGFLGLHALATPGVLLSGSNLGFAIATPVGLILASLFAAASISPLAGPRGEIVLRYRSALRAAVVVPMVAWAILSLLGMPPLSGPPPPREVLGPIGLLGAGSVALFGIAAWRYGEIFRRRRSPVALATFAAMVLLAEAMIAVVLSRNWQLSWWEWHVLLAVAFGAIALGTRAEYRRTGSLVAAFSPIYLEATLARISRWHARAVADLAAADATGGDADAILAELRRDGASTDEIALLRASAREMRRLDELFRPYLPQHVAGRLRREPEAGRLETETRTVTAVFADLAGFTTFSETRPPTEVIDMLNEQWAAAVPVIDRAGGTIENFAGDGVLVLFNAVLDQPDHAVRGVTCARDLIAATDPIAARHDGWPRFRIGVNTGSVAVGSVGAAERRSFASIGDTVNLASRLSGVGGPGQVVVGLETQRQIAGTIATVALGSVTVKGKRQPVEAWRVAEG